MIVLAAREASVSLYAACESLKISPSQRLLTELHPGAEVWKDPLSGLSLRNLYVERVAPDLVTGIVTERGLIEPREASRIASAKRRALKAIGAGEV